ncbi:DUF4139 domain-containing protein, partial [Kitasatospora sp. LaBMicrA B282]|uniref:DUF4139 domain-containing protein n=1 Tax=Kitasatospora sp. LaBMicrA B282 TaxID=3420949 RepID=UPI003D10BDE7
MTDLPADTTSPPVPHWPSTLDSVVVHAAGAVCRRLAHGALPTAAGPDPATDPGRLRLCVTGLPDTAEPGSLRAALPAGPAGWRVTEVRLTAQARLTDPAELPELRRRLTAAEQREAALRLRERQLADRIARLAEVRPTTPKRRAEDPHRRVPADALLTLADFVEERLGALHAAAAETEERLRQAVRERELLGARVDLASTAELRTPVGTRAVALVTLTRDTATGPDAPDSPDTPHTPTGPESPDATAAPTTPFTVELEYRVPGARWLPTYRLDHRRGAGTGTLTLRAAIAQTTGEDWHDVRLALSTADLLRPAEPPKLRSIRIGRRQPAPAPSGWREPPRGLDELFGDYDLAQLTRPEEDFPLPVGSPVMAPRHRRAAAVARSALPAPPVPLAVAGLPVPGAPGAPAPVGYG